MYGGTVLPAEHRPSGRLVALALLGAVTAISFAAVFFKRAAPTHPLVAAGLRLVMSCLCLAVPTWRFWRRGKLSPRFLKAASLGGLFYGLHFGSWVASLNLTSVAASVTLVTATPLFLAVIGLLTGRDRPERRHWLALVLACVGVSVIGGSDWSLSQAALLGDGLALLGALAMALYFLAGRSLGAAMDVWAFTGIATGIGGVLLLGAAACLGIPPVAASWPALGYLALAALIPQLIGHSLLTWSLRYASPTEVGMATLGEPAGATFLAWVWLGDGVGLGTAIGCALTLVAVMTALPRGRAAETAAASSPAATG